MNVEPMEEIIQRMKEAMLYGLMVPGRFLRWDEKPEITQQMNATEIEAVLEKLGFNKQPDGDGWYWSNALLNVGVFYTVVDDRLVDVWLAAPRAPMPVRVRAPNELKRLMRQSLRWDLEPETKQHWLRLELDENLDWQIHITRKVTTGWLKGSVCRDESAIALAMGVLAGESHAAILDDRLRDLGFLPV